MSDAPEHIWACMGGPMVGLFVSGGNNGGWPEYVRADIVPHVNETPKSEHDERDMLTLTAERDRLREALRHIVTHLAEPTVASEDTLNSLRGDLRFVGRVASAALKGETL